jgi:hypothetical protein
MYVEEEDYETLNRVIMQMKIRKWFLVSIDKEENHANI